MGVVTSDPATEKPGNPAKKWIVTTVVLLVAVVGLGAWALSLRSDVDDKDAQIAAQQQQLEEQQGVADDVQEAASGFAEDAQQALIELGEQLGQAASEAQATQEETQQAIEDAEQAAEDAAARADSAEDEVAEANARADEATARGRGRRRVRARLPVGDRERVRRRVDLRGRRPGEDRHRGAQLVLPGEAGLLTAGGARPGRCRVNHSESRAKIATAPIARLRPSSWASP